MVESGEGEQNSSPARSSTYQCLATDRLQPTLLRRSGLQHSCGTLHKTCAAHCSPSHAATSAASAGGWRQPRQRAAHGLRVGRRPGAGGPAPAQCAGLCHGTDGPYDRLLRRYIEACPEITARQVPRIWRRERCSAASTASQRSQASQSMYCSRAAATSSRKMTGFKASSSQQVFP